MNPGSGGEIVVHLKLDDKQFNAAARTADTTGKALGDKLDADTKAATDRVGARFEGMGLLIKRSLLGVGLAAGAAGVASIKMAGDFEKGLNVLQYASGATSDEMKALREQALKLGNDLSLPGVSATDAAGAMTELAKAGISVNDTLSASKGVLSLAKAGQIDVSEAALVAARALNAFGLQGSEAGKVADVLAAGANASTADVGELAYALSQGGSAAARMKVSLGDTVTALALFSNAGINGSDAGTSLKTMLQRLAAPTDEAAGVMKKLGLTFFDAKGNFVGLSSTAEQLQSKLGSLTQQQREQAIAAIFGSDASRVAGVLAAQGAEGFDKMSGSVNKAGAATDAAAAQNKGFNGALENLKSTLETIGTQYGEKMLKPLTEFVNLVADKANPAAKFLAENIELITKVLIGLGGAFAAVRVAGFVSDMAKAEKTLSLFVGGKNAAGIKALATAFKAFGGVAMTVIRGVGAAILANPIFFAIAAIIAILVFLQVKFNIFGKLFEALKPILKSVGDFFVKVWQGIQDVVGTVINALVGFWNSKLKPVFDVMISVLKFVLGIYIKVWAFILLVVVGTLSIIAAVVWAVMQGIWNVITTVWNAIWGVISAVLGFIWNAIVTAFNFYFSIISAVLGFIWGVITTVWNAIYGVISSVLGTIWGVITGIWNSIYGFLSGIVGAVWDRISTGFKNIYNGVKGILGDLINFVGGIGGQILGKLGNFGKLLFDKGKDLIQGLLDGAGSLLSKIGSFFLDKVPGWIQAPFKKALGISSPSKVFSGFGKNIVEGLANGIAGSASLAENAANRLGDQVAGINAGLSGNIAVGADGLGGGSAAGAGATIVQNNNVYNQVDLDAVSRELAWQVRR